MAVSQTVWRSESPEQTVAIGVALGRCAAGGLTIGLVGNLGAGKTQLVKGLAKGNALHAVPAVTSPTFTLIHEYPGRLTLYHVDTYRLNGSPDLEALGFAELIGPGSVVVVEWADRVASSMPADTLWIGLTATGPSHRELAVEAKGAVSSGCLDAARELLGR